MKNTFAIIIFLLVRTLTGTAQTLTDIRIMHEDQQSVVLEFTPHITAEHVTGTHGGIFTRFHFFESQITFDTTGQADFSRNILLLFPSTRYSFQVLGSEFQTRDSTKLLPKPTIKSLKDFGISESYDDAKFIQEARSSSQRSLAEVVRVGKTSIGSVGTIILRPIQVIDKKRVKVFSRITIRLEFKDAFQNGMRSTCFLRGELPKKAQLSKTMQIGLRKITAGNSPFAQGDWYRIDVTDAGMYKLDFNYLHNLNISVSDINSIRLFGNGGLVIPDNTTDPVPDSLVEIPRLVVRKNSIGTDTADYIIFYGRGVRGWHYNADSKNFQHYINPYTEKNSYFVTVSQETGIQMDSIVSPSPTSTSLQYFQEKIFNEKEQTNLLNTGKRWAWSEFSGTNNTYTYYNSLPGIVSNTQINYAFNFMRRSSFTDLLNIFENGIQLQQSQSSMSPTTMGDGETGSYAEDLPVTATGGLPQPNPNSSVVKIQVTSSDQASETWLDWLEIYYQRKFEALNDALLFTTSDTAGSIQYSVSNLSSEVRAFDVTNHDGVKQIKFNQTGSSCTFQLQQTAGSVCQIAVVGKNGYVTPSTATKIQKFVPNNLHDFQNQIDFIIISPAEFISEANRLKDYRQLNDSLNTLVVDIQQIFNEFSGGLPDPLAIREFLNYTQNNWVDPKPRYVLLFGAGHFDYKNISTNQHNWVPPVETEESFETMDSYPSDDKFVMLGPSYSYALAIGRFPARNLKDVTTMVDKVISYETTSPLDPWRNRITFVSDDGKTSTGDDGSTYTDHSEEISESPALINYEKTKIYEVAYPTVNSAGGRTKPDVNKAIVNAINSGTIITNYIGHGNDRLWAHEAVFTREGDLPQLVNKDRLTFIVTATCSYGWYDNPNEISAGEQLVTMEQGGAIADFTAARVVYDPPNFALDVSLFNYLLQRNSNGQFPRIGDACLFAKSINGDLDNTRKFHLLGDPTVRLLMPKDSATVDSINGFSISANNAIKIKSLGQAHIAGTVKQNNALISLFNGTGTLQLFDSQKDVSIIDGVVYNNLFQFKVTGSLLYSGDVSITNGHYEAIVPIPKDVTIGKSARISIYAWNGQSDATGSTENVMIEGIDTTIARDTVGPVIAVYLDTIAFHPGGVVKSNPIIIVQLEDESGINTSTVGVGHQLSATISNPVRTFDLSSYYHSSLDNYKKGEVRYQLNDLSDGKYTLSVKAWDNQNNSSEAETFFEVHSVDDFALLNAVNYPNPFSNSTTFTFQRASYDPIDVQIKIYSIAGRLIGNISVQNIADSFVRIPWDGKDNDGNELANGIYFYKLIARDKNGQRSSETIGKLAVMR
ncbi:MAG: type IX secretion system sortase PorU [Bacteroidota bacterium]|jgi:hypothetical protein